jgi:hypothetical protein
MRSPSDESQKQTKTLTTSPPPEVEEWWVENVKSMYDLESSRDVFQAVLRLSVKQYVCVIEVGLMLVGQYSGSGRR